MSELSEFESEIDVDPSRAVDIEWFVESRNASEEDQSSIDRLVFGSPAI